MEQQLRQRLHVGDGDCQLRMVEDSQRLEAVYWFADSADEPDPTLQLIHPGEHHGTVEQREPPASVDATAEIQASCCDPQVNERRTATFYERGSLRP